MIWVNNLNIIFNLKETSFSKAILTYIDIYHNLFENESYTTDTNRLTYG